MARRISESANFTNKDVFNITGAESLESIKGSTIKVVGGALGLDVSHETGEVATGYLKDSEGNIYSTISPTAQQSIEALIDMFADGEAKEVTIKVNTRKSNAGREFIVLTML